MHAAEELCALDSQGRPRLTIVRTRETNAGHRPSPHALLQLDPARLPSPGRCRPT